jgi:hypothetical protein
LQKFLVSQYKAIGNEYQALKDGGALNWARPTNND